MTALNTDWVAAEYRGNGALLWPLVGNAVAGAQLIRGAEGLEVLLSGATDTLNIQGAAPFSLKSASGGRFFVPITLLAGANYVLDIGMHRWLVGPNASAIFEISGGSLSFDAHDTLGNHVSAGPIAYSPTSHAFFVFHWNGVDLLLETESTSGAFTTQLTVHNMATFIDYFWFVIGFQTGGFPGPSSYVLPEMNESDGSVVAIRASTSAYAAALSLLLGWTQTGSAATLSDELARIISDVERTF